MHQTWTFFEEQTLADLERDFAEFARSVGFKGDVSQLWEEAMRRRTMLDM